jgi:hypothetical protein
LEDVVTKTQSTLIGLMLGALFAYPTPSAAHGSVVYWTALLMPSCEHNVDGFAARSSEPYAKWRQKYAEELAAYEQHRSAVPDSAPQEADLAQLRSECEKLLNFILDDVHPPDPRFATPEGTWNVLLSALRSGDKATLAECFGPSDRANYMSSFEQMQPAQLADVARSFTDFELLSSSAEDFQEAVVVRADGVAGIALFVKTSRGWLLSQL